ncbi:MAG: 2-hydroxychromene-2-carboxylate isomerase [Deltaproteobacteria bacterium]|nr:2-hydroxychromene-2-carboxylate isomerase [Deltaproteobacteria bacterium]
MPSETGSIRFYFDYISSNAYLAWARLPELAARYGRSVEPVPSLFAGLLNAHGQLGPAEVLPKAWWMCKNNLRKAALIDLPLRAPAAHPFNPLLPLRVSSLSMPAGTKSKLISGLFAGHWARRVDISKPDAVAAIATEAGLDGEKALREAQAPEIKQHLRETTEAAVAEGVFGVPTMIVDGELFWGYDDFPYLERFLAGEDPLDREALTEWAEIPRAVRRRRPGESAAP